MRIFQWHLHDPILWLISKHLMAEIDTDIMAPDVIRSAVTKYGANKIIGTCAVRRMMLNIIQPAGRIGEPEEIAEVAVWLGIDAASFVTGNARLVAGEMKVV